MRKVIKTIPGTWIAFKGTDGVFYYSECTTHWFESESYYGSWDHCPTRDELDLIVELNTQ